MFFQFTRNNQKLTKGAIEGGQGVTAEELLGIHRWQEVLDYEFNFHSGSHGNQCVYVVNYLDHQGRDFPCIWLEGTKESRNLEKLSKKGRKDALEVVAANKDLFLRMARAFNV